MFVDHGHHAGFDLPLFINAGGYDETFSHNEDAEFDVRLRRAGHRIFLDAQIRVSYLPRASVRGLARQYYNYGRGRARTLLKHGEKPRLRQLIPPATLMACVSGVALAPLSAWTLAVPAVYLSVLLGASLGIALRRRSACGLLAGLASAVMHMSWAAGLLRQLFAFSHRPRRRHTDRRWGLSIRAGRFGKAFRAPERARAHLSAAPATVLTRAKASVES